MPSRQTGESATLAARPEHQPPVEVAGDTAREPRQQREIPMPERGPAIAPLLLVHPGLPSAPIRPPGRAPRVGGCRPATLTGSAPGSAGGPW
jgi:hypothetical protein